MAIIDKITTAITPLEQVDKINEIIDNLGGGSGGSSLLLGQTIQSLDPLNDARLHLYDGSLLPVGGVYDDFITNYIIPLYNSNPSRFITETEWQNAVAQYGVCGRYVYSAGVSVRLPKVTGFVEGTLDASVLGDVVPAGLPNITGKTNFANCYLGKDAIQEGCFNTADIDSYKVTSASNGNWEAGFLSIDASLSNSIYGNSSTVQPQAIKGYLYIVVATGTTSMSSETEANINSILTDLNNLSTNKANNDLSNCTKPYVVETYESGSNGYILYSNKWIKQYGVYDNGSKVRDFTADIVLFKEFKSDRKYIITAIPFNEENSNACMSIGVKNVSSSGFRLTAYGNGSGDAIRYFAWEAEGYIN